MAKASNKLILNYNEVIKHPVISLKKLIHPIFLSMMPGRRDYELKFINEKPNVEGPVLYLMTHAKSHDGPVVSEALKDHFYVMVGKQPLEFVDNLFFHANGKIEVNRDNKESGRKAIEKSVNLLKNGVDVVMCPEATWCVEPSKPINHCHYGWFDIAKNSGATVVPIAIEYYEYTDNCCYINFGSPFKVSEMDDKKEKTFELEEKLVTLKFEIWNQFPQMKSSEVDRNLWNEIIEKRYNEYPKLDRENEKNYIVGIKNSPERVLNSPEYLTGIKKIEEIYGPVDEMQKNDEKSR